MEDEHIIEWLIAASGVMVSGFMCGAKLAGWFKITWLECFYPVLLPTALFFAVIALIFVTLGIAWLLCKIFTGRNLL